MSERVKIDIYRKIEPRHWWSPKWEWSNSVSVPRTLFRDGEIYKIGDRLFKAVWVEEQ